jgi:hypothetical protein
MAQLEIPDRLYRLFQLARTIGAGRKAKAKRKAQQQS